MNNNNYTARKNNKKPSILQGVYYRVCYKDCS